MFNIITTIAGFILIVYGFALRHSLKKEKKKNPDLRYGEIKSVRETEEGNLVLVDYAEDNTVKSAELLLDKVPADDFIYFYQNLDGTFSLYKENLLQILLPVFFWIAGAVLCAI